MAHEIETITLRLDRSTANTPRINHWWATPLRLPLTLPTATPWDGCLEVRAEVHAQRAIPGQMPLAVAAVPFPTGITVTAEFTSDQLALNPEAPNRSYWLLVRALWPSGNPESPNIDVYHLAQITLVPHPAADANPDPPPPVVPYAPASVVEALTEQIAEAAPLGALAAEVQARQEADAALQVAVEDKLPVSEVGNTVAPLDDGVIPPAYLPHLIIDGGHVLNVILPSQFLSGGEVS